MSWFLHFNQPSLVGLTTLTVVATTTFLPVQAQMNDTEFQMGRAREACTSKARQQGLRVNRVVSTIPVNGSGGRTIGSDVTINVTRNGSTYNVRCSYDNSSRAATILGTAPSGSQTAIVNVNSLNVRLVPAMNGPVLYQAPRGMSFTVLGQQQVSTGLWYKVKARSSQYPPKEGWVFGQYVTLR